METFTETSPHRPLSTTDVSEIRVVALHPGDWDDPIMCTLNHVSLDDDPAYSTVSYVWGDPTAVYEITLDDVSYPVAANLFQVLHRLRDYQRWHPEDDVKPAEPLVLWIDALCINQADKIERSSQVQKMTEVYTKAEKVFACVGEVEPSKEESIEKLFSIPFEPLKRDEFSEEHGEDDNQDDRSVQSSTGPANWFSWKELADRVDGDAVELKQSTVDLCGEAFFSRIWIVHTLTRLPEELTLGRHLDGVILYGSHSTYAILLLELLMALRYDHVHNDQAMIEICKITANAFAMLSGGYGFIRPPETTTADLARHLIEMIHDTQHFHATEPRDKIYALLGLINKDLLPANLLPSYDEPVGSVYHAWTKFLLENTGDLSIIDGSFVQDPNIPTWVSSLSSGMNKKMTTPTEPTNIRFSADAKTLYVKGTLISFVVGSYSAPLLDNAPSRTFDSFSDDQKVTLLQQAQTMEETLIQHVRKDPAHRSSYLPYLFDLMIRQLRKPFNQPDQTEDLMQDVARVYEQIISNDNDTWMTNTSTEVVHTLRQILSSTDWVFLSTGSIFRVEARRDTIMPADEVYVLEGSNGLTVLRRCVEREVFQRIAYCDVGVEHEPWAGVEAQVNGGEEVDVDGREMFRPRVGVVEIAIS